MCGIAGFTSTKNIDNQILYDMIEEIKHRGPDTKGIYINKNVKFAHRSRRRRTTYGLQKKIKFCHRL